MSPQRGLVGRFIDADGSETTVSFDDDIRPKPADLVCYLVVAHIA